MSKPGQKTASVRSSDSGSRPSLPVIDPRSYLIFLKENPRYRSFWLSGVISQIGNWFNYIAIFVLLTKLTGSGMAVSWFLIAKFIPTSFLAPAAGVVADRFSRKSIMIVSDLLRVGVVLCFLFVEKPEHVWLVYSLALVQESIWTFYDPARRASVPNICASHELHLANALSGATWSVMLALGAAMGGFVTHWFGWETAIIVDAASFVISASIMARIDFPERKVAGRVASTWKDLTGITALWEGVRYVIHHREVAVLLLVKSGWALGGGVLVLLTVFGEQVFTTGGHGVGSGILYSFRGVGAALGPLLAWHILGESRNAMYRGICFSYFVVCAAYMAFARAPGILWAIPCVFIGHLGGSTQWVFSTTLLQESVPDQFRGRVFAAEMAMLTFILSLSTYFTGMALDTGSHPRVVATRLALIFLLPGAFWGLYLWIGRRVKG